MLVSETLAQLARSECLSQERASAVFELLLSGVMSEAQIGALLAMLQQRTLRDGACVDELLGAARVMRAHVARVQVPRDVPVLDTCGTGGAPKTFNVSTAAAIVTAAAASLNGVAKLRVAKHGNRSRTGRGSAEILQRLGVNVDASATQQARCLIEAGVCFCFAIHHHPAMKHAMPARRALGFPTIFNVLGPLTNPAGASRQLLGVYREDLVGPVASTLAGLACEAAMVVHSTDGLDELSITAPTIVAEVRGDGSIARRELDARTLGLAPATLEELRARDLDHAAEMMLGVLEGQESAAARMVVLNSAAALLVGGVEGNWPAAIERSRHAIASGSARDTLTTLARASHASA